MAVLSQAQVDRVVLEASGSPEKRGEQRHSFSMVQRISPCYRDACLANNAYQGVHCYDLSTHGISFYWPSKPAFSIALISLELPAGKFVIKAQVVHVQEVDSQTGEHVVGCRFLERVSSE